MTPPRRTEPYNCPTTGRSIKSPVGSVGKVDPVPNSEIGRVGLASTLSKRHNVGMAGTDASEAPARGGAQPRKRRPAPALPVAGSSLSVLEFPGCKPYRLTREQLGDFEGRLEFWDAATETAWVCEPTSPYHEAPSQILSAVADRIASVRGSPIKCYGAMDLLLRDEGGEARRIMQADQSVYLRPGRAKLPGPAAMVIGEHDFPDLVLEVDHSTDVRRGKLALYEAWGFPEVWVEVPEHRAPSRSTGRRPGLTIHRLERGAYRVSRESGAFPGWTAEDIHTAMNETTASARTYAVIERVGAALGAREGTGPDDDPLLRAQRRRGFDQGRFHGRAELVRQILLSRGIAVSEGFPAAVATAFAEWPEDDRVVAAALACENEADFLARLRPQGH